jgi:tight adherence protein C
MPITLVTLVTFIAVAGVVLSLVKTFAAESPLTQRLRGLVDAPTRTEAQQAQRRAQHGLVSQALAGIGRYGLGGDRSLSSRLSFAGLRGAHAPALFLGIRTLISVGPALLVVVPAVSSGNPLGRTFMIAVAVFLAGHLMMNLFLRRRIQERTGKITRALPDALDLMVVCLEAGLGLNATIGRVGEERAETKDLLGDEFAQVALELRNGRSRADALRALGDRNGVDDLKSLVGLIIQSDRLGASMARTLRTHADLLRTKRRQRAEEAARKLPVKMLFPLAFLILPVLFVVTTGPALLKLGELGTIMRKG